MSVNVEHVGPRRLGPTYQTRAGDEFKDKKNKDEVLVMHESDVLAVIG